MAQADAVLRKMTEDDLSLVLEWRNSSRVRAFMNSDHLISWDEHTRWFGGHVQSGKAIPYIFELNGTPAGFLQFTDVDRLSNRCQWGFYLGRDDLPRGTGSLMGKLGLQIAFEKLGIRKLCAEVLQFNKASIRMHQKLGFSLEGTFIRHLAKDEQFVDILHFAKFNELVEGGGRDA